MALGMSPAARFAGLVLVAAPIAVGGAVLAVAGALLASPMMPIGLARRAEPDPGFAIDWSVVVAGLLGVLALVCAAAALGRLANRPQRASHRRTRSTVASSSRGESVGCRSNARHGRGLAFDRRPPAIPSRSAIAGVTVAVTAVIAILTFSASLDRLLTTPDRWGYPWQLMLNFSSSEVEGAATELAADTQPCRRCAMGRGVLVRQRCAGAGRPGLMPLRGDVGFSLRSGRQPAAGRGRAGSGHGGQAACEHRRHGRRRSRSIVRTRAAQVVGIALFPEIDEGDLTNGVGYFGSGFATNATAPDLFETSQVVVTASAETTASTTSPSPERAVPGRGVRRERAVGAWRRRQPDGCAIAPSRDRDLHDRARIGLADARTRHDRRPPATRLGDAAQPRPHAATDHGLHRVASGHHRSVSGSCSGSRSG